MWLISCHLRHLDKFFYYCHYKNDIFYYQLTQLLFALGPQRREKVKKSKPVTSIVVLKKNLFSKREPTVRELERCSNWKECWTNVCIRINYWKKARESMKTYLDHRVEIDKILREHRNELKISCYSSKLGL